MGDNYVYVLLVGEDMLSAIFFSVSKEKFKLVRAIQQTYKNTEGIGEIIEEDLDNFCRYTYYSAMLERNRSFIISKEYLL